MAVSKNVDFAVQQSLLNATVKGILTTIYGENLPAEPAVKRNHIKWNEKYRMIIKGKEKGFYEGAVISLVTMYLSEKHLARRQSCGSIVLYAEEESAGRFLSLSGFSADEAKKDENLRDFCGEFCNMVSGGFINRLGREGFQEMLMSAPETYRAEIPEGIAFDRDNTEYLEFIFTLWGKHVFTIDLVLSSILMKG